MRTNLGRPSHIGTITIATANQEYNFHEHVQTIGGQKSFALKNNARGFLMKIRHGHAGSASSVIKWSYYTDKVTDSTNTGDGYVTIPPGETGGETGIDIDVYGDKLMNVYVSSETAGTIVEVQIFDGF